MDLVEGGLGQNKINNTFDTSNNNESELADIIRKSLTSIDSNTPKIIIKENIKFIDHLYKK